MDNDWRLQGQQKYLFGKTMIHKKYADKKTTTDHDHCEFCSGKFSTTIPDCLTEGYTTTDDYHWILQQQTIIIGYVKIALMTLGTTLNGRLNKNK